MLRLIRVPAILDPCVDPLRSHVHGHHGRYVRLRVVAMAFRWGRRHGAHRYRSLDGEPHRTRVNHLCLGERWAPEAALRQQAQEVRHARRPGHGETLDGIIDDAKNATRGKAMDAIATRQAPTTAADIRGHQDVCARLVGREHVLPVGLRLSVNKAPGAAVGLPLRQTTALAAPRLRAFTPPTGGTVVVWCEACSLCPTVVQACRAPPWPLASTLQRHRRLGTHGGQRNAGRSGRQRCRRRRPAPLDRATSSGPVRSRGVEAGGLEGSSRGPRHVVCARTGQATTSRGRVTDPPELAAPDVSRTDETRWTIAPWRPAVQPWLGRGPDQHRPDWAAVTHRQLVCLA